MSSMTFLPPFRADHVGSLLRPKELSAARKEWREGWITAEQLRSIEDNHILKAVKNQELWKKLEDLSKKHIVEWRWVKGHSGHPGNGRRVACRYSHLAIG